MATVSKITETLFDQIKTELEHVSPIVTAQVNHLSLKTILQIKGSNDYADYEQQKAAQHQPSNKTSMRDELAELNKKMDMIIKGLGLNTNQERLL